MVLRYAEDPALGLAKLLCAGSLLRHGPLLPSTDRFLTASVFHSLSTSSFQTPTWSLGTCVNLLGADLNTKLILLPPYISSALRYILIPYLICRPSNPNLKPVPYSTTRWKQKSLIPPWMQRSTLLQRTPLLRTHRSPLSLTPPWSLLSLISL